MALSTKSPNPTDKHLGNRVRMRRMMLGVSQTTLGESMGVTFQQVQKYEKGINRISAVRLQAIAQILQVPISYFFDGVATPAKAAGPSPQFINEFVATPAGMRLTRAFTSIDDPQLQLRVVRLVEGIAGLKAA